MNTIPHRMPVYRGMIHFLAAHLRKFVHNLFQMGMRDCMNRAIMEGDKVFDTDFWKRDRKFHDPANTGRVVKDNHSITGLSIIWGNNEISQLIDPTRLLKKNTA